MWTLDETDFKTKSEISVLSNGDLISALSEIGHELKLCGGSYHDYDDQPIAERFTEDDKKMLESQLSMLMSELQSRMTGDAMLNRLNALNKQVKDLRSRLQAFKESGINSEVMIYWMHHKSKINVGDIRDMLEAQDSFFKQLFNP